MTDLRIAIQHTSLGELGWSKWLKPIDAAVVYQSLPWGAWKRTTIVLSRPVTGEDYRDFATAQALGTLNFPHTLLEVHQVKREKQRTIAELLDEAYELAGLDRWRSYRNISADMEAVNTSGIWARSTGEYAARCARLDDEVLAKSPAIRQTIFEIEARGVGG